MKITLSSLSNYFNFTRLRRWASQAELRNFLLRFFLRVFIGLIWKFICSPKTILSRAWCICFSKFWKKIFLPGKFRKIDKVGINLISPHYINNVELSVIFKSHNKFSLKILFFGKRHFSQKENFLKILGKFQEKRCIMPFLIL